jgi:hypothetical protein
MTDAGNRPEMPRLDRRQRDPVVRENPSRQQAIDPLGSMRGTIAPRWR